jgi:hypothetical protein
LKDLWLELGKKCYSKDSSPQILGGLIYGKGSNWIYSVISQRVEVNLMGKNLRKRDLSL